MSCWKRLHACATPALAMHNAPSAFSELRRRTPVFRPPEWTRDPTKAYLHISDCAEEPAYKQRDTGAVAIVELAQARTLLNVPMTKDGQLMGYFALYRQEVRPFTEKQIELVANFAAQAVIATLNAVRISAGRRWAVRTSTRMMRGGRCGMANGRARKIANAWASTTTVTQIFPI
jgi:GAF domain-containing protein